jgi:hypothetical protein
MRHFIQIVESGQGLDETKFRQWFSGSKVVDSAGNPLIVYRGEHGENSSGETFHTRVASTTFASQKAAELYARNPNNRSEIAKSPRVHSCYLSIKNPVMHELHDPYIDLSIIEKAIGRDKALMIAEKNQEDFEYTNNWEELMDTYETPLDAYLAGEDVYMSAYVIFDTPEYVAWFKAAGYDGAIHGGNGATAEETEYKIFSHDQAWPINLVQLNKFG